MFSVRPAPKSIRISSM